MSKKSCEEIRSLMRIAKTYSPAFEPIIELLDRTRSELRKAEKAWRDGGGEFTSTYTNKAGAVTGAILAFVPREAEPKEEQLGEFMVNADIFGWKMLHSTLNSTFATRHDMMALEVSLHEIEVEA